MLRDIWDNAPTTAAMYVGIILFLYAVGMFLLLIYSIRQRTDEVTMYDVYLELMDAANFVRSLFQSSKKESVKKDTKVAAQLSLKRAQTKIAADDEDGSGTIEGKLSILHQYKIRMFLIKFCFILFDIPLFCIFILKIVAARDYFSTKLTKKMT